MIIRSAPQTVMSVVERRRSVYVGGYGPDTTFREVSEGWSISLTGSPSHLHVGDERPDLQTGDQVTLEIRRINR